jgi:lipoprotein-anchoring transpeptidase ErfK/SrfK
MSKVIPKITFIVVVLLGFYTQVVKAKAETDITISKSRQRMIVHSSEGSYSWPVSTARRGYYTPTGSFRPYSLQPMHYSRKYDNAPMPHSIFFSGGYAIHATPHTGNLGRPASHGCVRLSPGNAATLYRIVRNDMGETTIRIVN